MAQNQKIVIAFDFDGTIVDTARESFFSSAKAYEEMTSKKVSNNQNAKKYVQGRAFSLNAHSNYTLIKLIAENPKLDFSKYSQKEFDEEKEKNLEQAQLFVPLFHKYRDAGRETEEWFTSQPILPEIKHALKNLSKKYPLYIVSTKQMVSVNALLDYYKVEIQKDHIITDSIKETKEELLKKVAEIEKTSVSNVILFDDAIKQITSAQKIGARGVLIMWGEKRQLFINEAKKLGILIAYTPKKCLSIIQEIEGNKKVVKH